MNVSTLLEQTKAPVEPEHGTAGVYQIRNLHNGKIYVGSSVDLTKRWGDHKSDLRRDRHFNIYLQRSWDKYGEDAFVFETLITCHPEMCLWYEQQFLDQWDPEYNMNPKADRPPDRMGTSWGSHSDETKTKMSESAIRRGQKPSREALRKAIDANTGREPWNKGLSYDQGFSDEALEKMRIGGRKRPSDETRRKMSAYAKDRPKEHNEKISLAKKKWWAERNAHV